MDTDMRHTLPLATQFYVTAPQPCPYLADRMERKLFTALEGDHAVILSNELSRQGFRRSQNVLYRPSCANCNACISTRIRVADFKPRRSHRKVLRKNTPLIRQTSDAFATQEQFDLFRAYLNARHIDGGMANMDIFEFSEMIEETSVYSQVIEYRAPATARTQPSEQRDELVAVCLTDVLEDGFSLVYSFFTPDLPQKSLGTYMILDQIEIAREAGLPHVYLGYWVHGSPKMEYKINFGAVEIFIDGKWQKLDDPSDFQPDKHLFCQESISEQVAGLGLPDALNKPRA